MVQRRVMKRGEAYEIEEKNRHGEWEIVSRVGTILAAKELLNNLKILDKEAKNAREK